MTHLTSTTARYSTNVRIFKPTQWLTFHSLRILFALFPEATGNWIKKRFFRPLRPPLTEVEQRLLDQARNFQIQVNGRRVEAWHWGTGPAVLLAHGWNGRGVHFRSFIESLIQAGCSAIAFDGPGHGASEGGTASYFEFTDAVRALLDPRLGLDIRGLIGHSFGAAAIVNTLAHEQLNLPAALLAPPLKLRELLQATFDRYGIPPAIYHALIGEYETRYGYSLKRDNPHLHLKDLPAELLVVHDPGDPVVAYHDSQTLCRQYPHATLLTTRDLGHKRILQDPEVISACLVHLGIEPQPTGAGNPQTHLREETVS